MREIVDTSPDVICLQEVQADHYENHLYAAMSEQGFEGVYKQKTRQSMGLAGKVDGCALFWRRSKFHLVESYSIEFNELAQRQATQVLGLNPRSDEAASFLNRLSKDNIAQLVVLELAQPTLATRTNRDPINQVCIANTHLYSNKDFPDVKLWQAWQLLQELENFVLSRGTNLPLMICGDFNSTPDTAVYDLLARQTVHPGHPDVNITTGDDVPNVLPDPMNITHSFQLGSAYQTVLGEEPIQTNYTVNFKGVLDYMWYSVQNLRPLSAAPIPDESVLTRHGEGLPSTEFSSDHIMLISDMQIIGGSRPRVSLTTNPRSNQSLPDIIIERHQCSNVCGHATMWDVVLFQKVGDKLVEMGGIAFGETPSSFRAESDGQLAALRYLYHVLTRQSWSGDLHRTPPQALARYSAAVPSHGDLSIGTPKAILEDGPVPWKIQINTECDHIATHHLESQPSQAVTHVPFSQRPKRLSSLTTPRSQPPFKTPFDSAVEHVYPTPMINLKSNVFAKPIAGLCDNVSTKEPITQRVRTTNTSADGRSTTCSHSCNANTNDLLIPDRYVQLIQIGRRGTLKNPMPSRPQQNPFHTLHPSAGIL
eukprot:scaffold350_cov133-Cylindrotheca_fusiformis.AAC.15